MLRTLVDSLGDAGLGRHHHRARLPRPGQPQGLDARRPDLAITFAAGQAKAPENNCYFPVLLTEDKGFVAPNGSRPPACDAEHSPQKRDRP